MINKSILTLVFVLFISANISFSQETLYKRLGGYDAIAAVTDDFVIKLVTNEDMQKFFKGASDDSKKKIRQHIVDYFCEKTGGPCYYTGRTMKDSHKGLMISEKEWNVAAGLLVETLDKFKVPHAEKDEFLAIVVQAKSDIVEKP